MLGSLERAIISHWATYVQSSKLLLALASTVIFSFESHETHDHILLPDGSGSLQAHLYECLIPGFVNGR
jgi:hypothetical protein